VGRIPRSSLPDGFFHVYCRGVASAVAFPDGDDRSTFLGLLRMCSRRHRWTCHAACVLSTHYHLVVDARREALSRGVHQLNWRYARYYNRRYGTFGHVFAERFQTRAIEGEERVFETCAYVLLNPVKARLCERVEDWPWSYSRYGLAAS
jgi:putative transposase